MNMVSTGDEAALNPPARQNVLKHRVTLVFRSKGTYNGYSAGGPTSTCMKIDENKAIETFAHPSMAIDTAERRTKALNAIQNANITKMELLQCTNTFPTETGVSNNLVPNAEIVESGERYLYTTIPGTHISQPQTLYEAKDDSHHSREWASKYGSYSSENLETQGVLNVPKCPYLFVHKDHPVINLIKVNEGVLGLKLSDADTMDDQWYKVSQDLMTDACHKLRTDVLSKINTRDLSALQLQLHRLDGNDWGEVEHPEMALTFSKSPDWTEEETRKALKQHQENYIHKPCFFMARIGVEYELTVD